MKTLEKLLLVKETIMHLIVYQTILTSEMFINVMIDGKKFFYQAIKNDKITYENIRKIATGQGDNYTFDCLLDNTYFRDVYKMIAIDLSKQQALDADPRAIQ